ncbi:MAG: DegT/DnrJ/EryC1/StrS family aminotransferase [Bacteroidales bacterium]|nr:DegT/DnrJ/EryC1/StrS family aminotransferase [Bacteroidales bacterium]
MYRGIYGEYIPLLKPLMPPLDEVIPYLERIWESGMLTNEGPIHAEFEQSLCRYLGVNYISLCSSGSTALMIALKGIGLSGQVITTPFTFPATLQAIIWNNLEPVFVDINARDLNLDEGLLESAITPRTTAVLPVHVFGTPCNVSMIGQMARKYGIRVIYDAAHSFGVSINGTSICSYGDLSVLSFHATKVLNTFEGGAIVCHDEEMKRNMDALKNAEATARPKPAECGINVKMNEFQAAFGLCQLKHIDRALAGRKAAVLKYKELLKGMNGLRFLPASEGVSYNYTFLPVVLDPAEFGAGRDELHDFLRDNNITTRKYFFPLACDLPEFSKFKTEEMPVAQSIASSILCLPLFHDITDEQIMSVVAAIYRFHTKRHQNRRNC